MLVLTQNKTSMPNNIKIVELDNNQNCNKIAICHLTKKLMPQYYGGLAFFRGITYDKIFAAIDENNSALVGAILVINKNKLDKNESKHIEFIDFLMVEEDYRNKNIASGLINKVMDYAKNKNNSYVELMCAIENSLLPNVYDKNEFNRVAVHEDNEVFNFRVNVNKSIRDYGKLFFIALNESIREGANNFNQLKGIANDDYYLNFMAMQANMPKVKCKKIFNSSEFELLNPVASALLEEQKTFQSVDEKLKGVLKYHSKKNIKVVKPSYNKFGINDISKFCCYSSIDDYLNYQPKDVNFVKQVNGVAMDMTKDIYLLNHFSEKLR